MYDGQTACNRRNAGICTANESVLQNENWEQLTPGGRSLLLRNTEREIQEETHNSAVMDEFCCRFLFNLRLMIAAAFLA